MTENQTKEAWEEKMRSSLVKEWRSSPFCQDLEKLDYPVRVIEETLLLIQRKAIQVATHQAEQRVAREVLDRIKYLAGDNTITNEAIQIVEIERKV